jgi:hypothetical protein
LICINRYFVPFRIDCEAAFICGEAFIAAQRGMGKPRLFTCSSSLRSSADEGAAHLNSLPNGKAGKAEHKIRNALDK